MTISVTQDGRILVDGIQHGCKYRCIAIANNEAVKVQQTCYPKAKIYLAHIVPIAPIAPIAPEPTTNIPTTEKKSRKKVDITQAI